MIQNCNNYHIVFCSSLKKCTLCHMFLNVMFVKQYLCGIVINLFIELALRMRIIHVTALGYKNTLYYFKYKIKSH